MYGKPCTGRTSANPQVVQRPRAEDHPKEDHPQAGRDGGRTRGRPPQMDIYCVFI